MKKTRIFFILIVLGVLGASLLANGILFKQRNQALSDLKEKTFQAEVLSEDNKNLSSDNEALKREIESKKEVQQGVVEKSSQLDNQVRLAEEKYSRLKVYLRKAVERIKQLHGDVAILKEEIVARKEENDALKKEIAEAEKKKVKRD